MAHTAAGRLILKHWEDAHTALPLLRAAAEGVARRGLPDDHAVEGDQGLAVVDGDQHGREQGGEWESGDPYAQVLLAVLYAHGLGVEADADEAVRWLRVAAAQGHGDALMRCAQLKRELQRREADDAPVTQADLPFAKAVREVLHPRTW
jgi:TPR repeat protein